MTVEIFDEFGDQSLLRFRIPYQTRWLQTYLIQGPLGGMYVDTGPANEPELVAAMVGAAGTPTRQRCYLLLTHADADHRGSASAIVREIQRVTVIAGSHEIEMIRSPEHTVAVRYRGDVGALARMDAGVSVHVGVGLGGEVDIALGPSTEDVWTVIPLPGHTEGSIGVWNRARSIAIVGDAVQRSGFLDREGLIALPPLYESANSYRESLAMLKRFGLSYMFDGHFSPAVGERRVAVALDESMAVSNRLRDLVRQHLPDRRAATRAAREIFGSTSAVVEWTIAAEERDI